MRGSSFIALLAAPLALSSHVQAAKSDTNAAKTLVIRTHSIAPKLEGIEQEACFPVDEIRIEGVLLVDVKTLQEKVQPLAYQCLGNTVARSIVGAINKLHAKNGFVTTQGYLPDQDIRGTRRLDINIVPGTIDKVIYHEKGREDGRDFKGRVSAHWETVGNAQGPWGLLSALSDLFDTIDHPLDQFQILDGEHWPAVKRWGATGLESGDVVHLDTLQESIDVFNGLSSNHVSAKLAPGDQSGTSHIVLTNERTDSLRLTVGYDINGASLSGLDNTIDKRLRFDLEKDNLIGINDSWRTTFATGRSSNELKSHFSVPWRRFKFSATGGYTESTSLVTPTVEYLYRSGEVNGNITYLLDRTRNSNTKLEGGLGWRNIERYINTAHLQPQTVTASNIGFARTHYFVPEVGSDSFFLGHEINYGLSVAKGLPIFGAMRDSPTILWAAPRAQFWKLDGKVSLRQGLRNIGILRMDLTAQWSTNPLFSSEQLSLGSISTVRGFNNVAAKVDRGAILRTEFSPSLHVDSWMGQDAKGNLPFIYDMLRATQPYLFIDAGHGRQLATNTDLTRVGVGGGVRINHGRTSLDLSIAHRTYERGTRNVRHAPEVYFSINTRLL